MEFNNRRERKRFETEWAKLRQEYHNAGMSEDAIQSLYLFDFSVFKRSRSIAAWEEPFKNESEDGESKEYALLHRYASLLSKDDTYFADADRFSWIERISDEALYTKLQALSEQDKELLTLLAFDGYSKTEIGKMRGRSTSAVCQKIDRLGKYLFSA